jgi:D-alanine-D-alanine ligase
VKSPSKILVLYNSVTKSQGEDKEILADEENIIMANDVAQALSPKHETKLFNVDEKTIHKIKDEKFDLIFNLTEGLGDLPKSDHLVARYLEKEGLPFTGSGSKTLELTGNKIATKKILLKNSVPTAKFYFISGDNEDIPSWLKFPLIVKPMNMHCSIGISTKSVVENEEELRQFLKSQEEKYNELFFFEEFIDGREVNVAIMGNADNLEVLPPSEISFGTNYPGKYKIVDFDAKWVESSETYKNTPSAPIINKLEEPLKTLLEDTAKKAFRLTNCQDYARVDFRIDKNGLPIVLEVNANQGIAIDSGTSRSARAAGYSYESFIQKIVDLATARLLS